LAETRASKADVVIAPLRSMSSRVMICTGSPVSMSVCLRLEQ
jgi:hypothetical protein